MPNRNIYIFALILILISIIFYSSNNFMGLNYIIDSLRSSFTVFQDKSDKFEIINPSSRRMYIKTYRKIPENFVHSGNFLFYKVNKDKKIRDIANEVISYTHYYNSYKLEKAIKSYNGFKSDTAGKGCAVYIPYSLPAYMPDVKRIVKPDIIDARGLYFTGQAIGNGNIFSRIGRFKSVGINTIVFDVKDVPGEISYFSHVPDVLEYNTHEKRTIDDIGKFIRALKDQGFYLIARIAVFSDHLLCRKRPDFAIRSASTGGIWNPGSKEIWCDPTNKNVQDYNIELAIELCEKGVDEIQFDYIRFPTGGNQNDAVYAYNFGRMSKEETITGFLKRAYQEISGRNVLLSIDVFGVVAWSKEIDIKKTGQRISSLARYCDVISPMLYPSHFNDDFDGIANPGDSPYHFILKGCKKTSELAGGKVIRPWLQAFNWRVSNYNEDYILKQIIGSREGGAFGYLFWNSKSSYDTVYNALYRLILSGHKKDSADND